MSRRFRNSRGFTLIEVMTAVMVLVIVVPVLATAFNIAANLAGLTRKRTEAASLAESTLEGIVAEQNFNQQSGELVTTGAYEYHWESSVEQWDEPNTELLTVKVTFMHRGREHEVALHTVVYVPGSTIQTGIGGLGGGGLP